MVKTHESVSIEIERSLKKMVKCHEQYGLKLVVHPELETYLKEIDKSYLFTLAEELNAHLDFCVDDNLHVNEYQFISTITNEPLEI